mmetsp:Transcript_20779/g.35683  ORF Transcript_20779/g.35683 Transcript_20779/m.35683 type:complete len:285 (-) Transcript_20779:365-1219(-)
MVQQSQLQGLFPKPAFGLDSVLAIDDHLVGHFDEQRCHVLRRAVVPRNAEHHADIADEAGDDLHDVVRLSGVQRLHILLQRHQVLHIVPRFIDGLHNRGLKALPHGVRLAMNSRPHREHRPEVGGRHLFLRGLQLREPPLPVLQLRQGADGLGDVLGLGVCVFLRLCQKRLQGVDPGLNQRVDLRHEALILRGFGHRICTAVRDAGDQSLRRLVQVDALWLGLQQLVHVFQVLRDCTDETISILIGALPPRSDGPQHRLKQLTKHLVQVFNEVGLDGSNRDLLD